MNNILYIYGYGSSPESSTCSWIKENITDANVVSVPYNQFDPEIAVKDLRATVKDHNINMIIGSSLGGWLTMHVAALTSLPCILINPLTDLKLEEVLTTICDDKRQIENYVRYRNQHPLFDPRENILERWDRTENGWVTIAILGDQDELITYKDDEEKEPLLRNISTIKVVHNAGHRLKDSEKGIIKEAYQELLKTAARINNFYKKSDIIP